MTTKAVLSEKMETEGECDLTIEMNSGNTKIRNSEA